MPKFDINTTRYAKFFNSREAASALSILVNDPNIIKLNYGYWRTRFATPRATEQRINGGEAAFMVKARRNDAPGMLNLRAPLGDTAPRENAPMEIYSGRIPDFIADGYVETAMERENKQRMLEENFGNDADIVLQFAEDIQKLVDDGNQTASYLAGAAMTSKSIAYDKGKGASLVFPNAPIPAENFLNAGSVAWSDPSCKIIDQMQAIEEKVRGTHGDISDFVWDMHEDFYKNVFLKNTQVIEYVKNWRSVNDKAYAEGIGVTSAMAEEAFAVDAPIAKIVVSKEHEYVDGVIVKGWKDNIVVFRPAGLVGTMRKASLMDPVMFNKYGSSAIQKVFANSDVFTIVNTTMNNGALKEWHTDLIVSLFPVLEEWPYHYIIDTATAE